MSMAQMPMVHNKLAKSLPIWVRQSSSQSLGMCVYEPFIDQCVQCPVIAASSSPAWDCSPAESPTETS